MLPTILRPGSPDRDKAEKMLLEETKNFEEQEDKTLDIHEPHRRDRKARLGETLPTLSDAFAMTHKMRQRRNNLRNTDYSKITLNQ